MTDSDDRNTAAAESSGGESTSTESTGNETTGTDGGDDEERKKNVANKNEQRKVDAEAAELRLKGQLIQQIRKRDTGETLTVPSVAGQLSQPPKAVEQILSKIATERSVIEETDSSYEVL